MEKHRSVTYESSNYRNRNKFSDDRHRSLRTDFSEREKSEILSRVKFVGAARAAREAGASKELVMKWIGEIDARISELNSELEKQIVTIATEDNIPEPPSVTPSKAPAGSVRGKRHNAEERLVIWNRANEVGRTQAAREYGISPVTIENWSWKYGMKTPPK